ncbi:acyl-CoA dehydrogenase family protein [Streptomyces sp. V4I23]|uniref:acyl-CoA dehydrogenase family protein n=1 Tax=Streptomyces sp. V4I23 TaxID=3042282 RepID=UPI0027D7964E|nr:acyl-CoA dehydrogenase family protein [Streptomyces sp. V4I23]
MTIDQVLPASFSQDVSDSATGSSYSGSAARADELISFLRQYTDERVNSSIMDDRRSVTPGAILDLGKAGLFGLQVQQKYGGQELSHADTYRVIAQAAVMDTNLALIVGVHNAIGVTPIRTFADERVKAEVLPQIARGTSLATLAVSEPDIGSNVQGIATTATSVPGGYVVNGTKCWISLGAWAGYVNLLTKTTDEKGRPKGLSAFLVEGRSAGFVPGLEAVTLGMRGFPQNRIDINNLRVSSDALLGAEGEGMAVAQSAFYGGRGMLGGACIGVMKRCLQLTARFAARRSVATGKLLDNGRAQQILSECMAATRAVEILVQQVADDLDAGREVSAELYSACKILSTELAFRVADWAVQLLGARGYLDTNIVGKLFRDIRLLRIFEGATETLTVYMGSVIAKDPQQLAELIGNRYGARSTLELLGKTYGDLMASLPESDRGTQTAYRNKHILANITGELACWGILAAMTEYTAKRTGTQLDQYTAFWAERQLADRMHTANDKKRQYGVFDADFLSERIAEYETSIGDVQQSLAGEDRKLDELLTRS